MLQKARIIELDDGKIYRKPLYLMVKTMVSCRFSPTNQSIDRIISRKVGKEDRAEWYQQFYDAWWRSPDFQWFPRARVVQPPVFFYSLQREFLETCKIEFFFFLIYKWDLTWSSIGFLGMDSEAIWGIPIFQDVVIVVASSLSKPWLSSGSIHVYRLPHLGLFLICILERRLPMFQDSQCLGVPSFGLTVLASFMVVGWFIMVYTHFNFCDYFSATSRQGSVAVFCLLEASGWDTWGYHLGLFSPAGFSLCVP